jgi:FkbM family methyltransferase
VGAQHPLKSSNTYRLYRRGWHGITVEPNAMLCALHRAVRRRDTVVCGAVGDVPGESEFYEMSPQVCSTFDAAQRDGYVARGDRLVRTSSRRIWTLAELFEANAVPASFGLLSIDVEGWDLRVLSSNDWSRWRPKMVIVEQNTEAAAAELSGFLTDRGYELVGLSLGKNAIYCETAAG